MPIDHESVHVLLIEDNDVDIEALTRAFQKQGIRNPLHVARDGIEALELLQRVDPPFPHPRVILLDLNLPRMNGIEFLRVLRADPALRNEIVFVLTTSNSHEDRLASYSLNVAGYVVKQELGDGIEGLARVLDQYWRLVEFPPRMAS